MQTITLAEAQAQLPQLVKTLDPGQEIVITCDDQPVAKLVGQAKPDLPARRSGTLKGTVLWMAPDFDAPLEDFKEYME